MTGPGCPFPDRARLALLEAAGRLEGADLARWDAHLEGCQTCAEHAVCTAATDAALAVELAAVPERAAPRRRGRTGVTWAVAASAVVALAFVGWRSGWGRGAGAASSHEAQIAEAGRLIDLGRRTEALALLERVLASDRVPGAVFLAGHAHLNSGRPARAIPLFREALDLAPATGTPDAAFDRGYVAGHLAQALLASASGAEHDAVVERLVREEMTGTGVGPSVNRALLWADLATRRAFSRGDLEGGEAALAQAERENQVHRDESGRLGRTDLDCHYVLHARFAFAEGVHGDSEEGRRVAAQLRATKRATAGRMVGAAARDSFLADGLEAEAVAELLAARRGDPADLEVARARLDEALALRTSAGNPEGLARVRTRLAWLELLAGNPDATRSWAIGAELDATKAGAPEELLDARLLRAQAYLGMGRVVEARRSLAAARATTGAAIDARRLLTVASIEAMTAENEVGRRQALARVRAAEASPLADVRRVAARTAASLEQGIVAGIGATDLGYDPRP